MIVDRIAKHLTSLPTELTEAGRCGKREARAIRKRYLEVTQALFDLHQQWLTYLGPRVLLFRMKRNQCLQADESVMVRRYCHSFRPWYLMFLNESVRVIHLVHTHKTSSNLDIYHEDRLLRCTPAYEKVWAGSSIFPSNYRDCTSD